MLKQDITPKIVKEVKKQYEKLKSMKKVKNKVNKELWIVLSRNDIRDILNGLYDDIKKSKKLIKRIKWWYKKEDWIWSYRWLLYFLS